MSDKILLVTPPDDVHLDGIRLLLVNLDEEQNQIVSQSLLSITSNDNIISYVWKTGNPIPWFLNVKNQSDLIIFNAQPDDSVDCEMINGYLAAQPNSYYFGNLRDLHFANDRVIYSSNELLNLLEKLAKQHG